MTPTLLETRNLDNGTTLHLYDASRRQAADRWIVTMEIRRTPKADRDQVLAELGVLTETFGPVKPTLSDDLAVEALAENEMELVEFESGAEDFEL